MGLKLKEIPVLVLNASYEPIHITHAKRALKWMVKGGIVVEAEKPHEIRRGVKLPSVVRLVEFRKVPRMIVRCSRKNVLLRDGYRCQYCGNIFHRRDLTLDHVVPKAQGGIGTWENLVAACHDCNHRKADRTPEQAQMKLLRRPRPLTIHTSRHMMRIMGSEDPAWRKFLYY